MEIKIVPIFEKAKDFLIDIGQDVSDIQQLWQKHMIEPYWADISCWAPFDQSFKKPQCVKELSALKEQLSILSSISLTDLRNDFLSIVNKLPSADDDSMSVFLYPACDSNKILKERQNGVVGTVVFGNIIININPLANDFRKWINFVFAHEYHHNVWGHHHFVLNGGKDTDGSFLEYMITEGQADLFAESLFPELIPQWNRPFDEATENLLWERIVPVLTSTSHEIHSQYMFGNESEGLPWCMGYSFGRKIVESFLNKHEDMSFSVMIGIPAKQILKDSSFCCSNAV
jgi:uncharacterized protein YjaZ